jgi:hypothetical protein
MLPSDVMNRFSSLAVPPLSVVARWLDGPAPWAARPVERLVARLQGT